MFERDAVGLIAAHPDVTFDIYLPPYSILQWVAMRDAAPETLDSVYAFSAYFCRRLAAFPNVRLYDFRSVSEVTHELNNYTNVIHPSPAIDRKVLSWLAAGNFHVDPPRRRYGSTGSRRRSRRIGWRILSGSRHPSPNHRSCFALLIRRYLDARHGWLFADAQNIGRDQFIAARQTTGEERPLCRVHVGARCRA